MEYAVIIFVALSVSTLTLFSGFGLGTMLMPTFALFFPIEVAVAATAVVHLANHLFKVLLIGKRADFVIVARFAIPAAVFAILGACLLVSFAEMPPLSRYAPFGRECQVTLIKLVIACLIAFFALFDLVPRLTRMSFEKKWIPLGGILSGFFGGLSGHQGALRTAFLIKTIQQKETFIGTVVVSAVIVDVTRLIIYGVTFFSPRFISLETGLPGLVLAGMLSAFAGSFVGLRLLKKVTMRGIQTVVGILLLLVALGLGTGLI
jgi:uncharacterized membrane protein YfcA